MESYIHSFAQFIIAHFFLMHKCANAPLLLLRIVERIQGVPPSCLVYTVVQVLRLRDKFPERKEIVYNIMFPFFAVKKIPPLILAGSSQQNKNSFPHL
jgi:hypothetical protein